MFGWDIFTKLPPPIWESALRVLISSFFASEAQRVFYYGKKPNETFFLRSGVPRRRKN
jgi:hypothetical protein|uniref:Uncharacterized protein n=1 Tax=Picea glauca TaxID=3330 RepID=A0A101LWE2_PICGL|nr:hypothetical protein ABT39_MTgene1672 [Picea glauca]